MNGQHFSGITAYPKMTHGDIEDADITKVSAFIKDMTGIGVLVPDDGLEDYIRQVGHLPERTWNTNTQILDEKRKDLQMQNQPPEPQNMNENKKKDKEDISQDMQEAAKRRLGRV